MPRHKLSQLRWQIHRCRAVDDLKHGQVCDRRANKVQMTEGVKTNASLWEALERPNKEDSYLSYALAKFNFQVETCAWVNLLLCPNPHGPGNIPAQQTRMHTLHASRRTMPGHETAFGLDDSLSLRF
jgi:hypothetical protein